jgi:DNA-directed RNA polymerase specialized sigma subunit
MNKHLTEKQFDVLKYSYGIRCEKLPAKEIAAKIGIQGSSAYVRVSQIKREAIEKLMDNVDATQVADCL